MITIKVPIIGEVIKDKKLGNKIKWYKKTKKRASILITRTPPDA